jgi:LPXTG-site transpeptidase (sortase) family protein
LLSLALALVALSPCLAAALEPRLHTVARVEAAPSPLAPALSARTALLTSVHHAIDGSRAEDAAFWGEAAEGEPVGRVVIPRMGLDAELIKGAAEEDLARGPGWMTTSDMPAASGNCVIAGHRTTHLAPFRRIDELRQGDEVFVETPSRVYAYEVLDTIVVDPGDAWVTATTATPRLTLAACHPEGSARLRLVVQARLTDVLRRPTDYGL